MKDSGKKISIFVIIFGIAIIISGIYNKYDIDSMKDNAVETKAIVTDIYHNSKVSMDKEKRREKSDYTVYISYTVDGQKYDTTYTSNSHIDIGSSVTIYYDKTNPNHTTTTLETNSSIVMSLIGVIIVIIGIFLLIKKVPILTN